jgi:tRNA dimethylallyltransferase
MDSMQVYRGMDIGTAKPTPAEQARVPHHLIDIVDAADSFSVVPFQQVAREAIAAVEARGRRALLVGGTGLYFQAVVDDLEFPGEDPAVRETIEARYEGPDGLIVAYARLRVEDPVAATRIEPGNRRRIVRALEVLELTGRPFSSFGPGVTGELRQVVPVRIAGLALGADEVSARIEARVRAMADAGLLDEVRTLAAAPWSRTARQAIGYKELVAYLEGEMPTVEAALTATVQRSRSFARRQRAWFRRDPRIEWFDAAGGKTPGLLDEVVAWWTAV